MSLRRAASVNITWNGTGAAWSYVYGNSSAVIEADGQRLLIDCGHTVPARLKQAGLALNEIDAVFISHLHGDHVYGLEEWGFRSLLQWHIRPRLFIAETLAGPLWNNVLAGTMGQTCDRLVPAQRLLRCGSPAPRQAPRIWPVHP